MPNENDAKTFAIRRERVGHDYLTITQNSNPLFIKFIVILHSEIELGFEHINS